MIKLFLFGAHVRRLLFSYKSLRGLFVDEFSFESHPFAADAYVSAHILDIEDAPWDVIADWRRSAKPIILLSEEPFWDTIWARQPLARMRYVETKWGPVPVFQLNHQTCDIFKFEKIPYYLLTNHRFANAYSSRFNRNHELKPSDWRAAFERRGVDTTFMFEKRPEPFHSVSWPEADLYGLCAWRTSVAEESNFRVVQKLGKTWEASKPARQILSDWHLDKLVVLDDSSRVISAIENTHEPNYVTEKIFDAFACGSMPIYFASRNHRLNDFQLPQNSYLNLFGMGVQEAVRAIAEVPWDDHTWSSEFFQGFTTAQQKLRTIFCDPAVWVQERKRLRNDTLKTFLSVLRGDFV